MAWNERHIRYGVREKWPIRESWLERMDYPWTVENETKTHLLSKDFAHARATSCEPSESGWIESAN
jgi:hypothetical protein